MDVTRSRPGGRSQRARLFSRQSDPGGTFSPETEAITVSKPAALANGWPRRHHSPRGVTPDAPASRHRRPVSRGEATVNSCGYSTEGDKAWRL